MYLKSTVAQDHLHTLFRLETILGLWKQNREAAPESASIHAELQKMFHTKAEDVGSQNKRRMLKY